MQGVSESITPQQKEKLFDRFLRIGFISKGIMYCLLGVLAVLTAADLGRSKASKQGTAQFIYDQPFGKFILVLLTLGMLGYVTLRLFQCFKDSDQKGKSLKALVIRAGYGLSAFMYIGFSFYAVKLVLRGPQHKGSLSQFVVEKVLDWPGGKWIICIVGLIVIGSGINQIYKGVSVKFMK